MASTVVAVYGKARAFVEGLARLPRSARAAVPHGHFARDYNTLRKLALEVSVALEVSIAQEVSVACFRFGEAWRGRRVRKWLETPAQAPVAASPPAVQRTLPTAADSFDSAATVLPLNFRLFIDRFR